MWDSPGSPSETCPNSSLSSARGARTSVSPLRGINHGHSRGIPTSQSHACPPPNPPVSSGARGPSLRRSALPTRRPSPASGQAAASSGWGHCLPPATKAPQRPWVGGRRGEWAHPCDPRGPADTEPRPTSSPSRALPFATPSGLRVCLPRPLPSVPLPTHHWPPQAPRTARVPPAPSLHQPSGKLSNLRSSPQLRSQGPRRARGAREGPGRTPTGCLAGSSPRKPSYSASFLH